MKRLLGISASCRVWGNCETSVKRTLVSATEAGALTDFIRLSDLTIHPCRGCFTCLIRGRQCPIDDDLYQLLRSLHWADGLVLAAPVYFMTPPAKLVALLDRLLTIARYKEPPTAPRFAVTMTIMGNRKWRGVAEPVVNMTASLLGFEIAESISLVAQGPGEVIMDGGLARRLEEVGRALAGDQSIAKAKRSGTCPVCRSDFFRIEPPFVICPICGCAGDLDEYVADGRFISSGRELRWGQAWLKKHIESWIEPSIRKHRQTRRAVLRNLRELKNRYGDRGERGKPDVQ